jgi:putative FmdB family regulatory protein
MPTYDYKCDACGNTWEQFQSMSAAPTKRCPKCGKNKARRLIGTGAGLIFKGSGFYITDYRDAGYKDKAKAEAGGGESTPSDGTKSETKPDTKSESKLADTPKPAAEAKPKTEPKTEPKPKSETPRKKKD